MEGRNDGRITKKITTLAIETSCDDTSIAIVSYDYETNFFSVDNILAYSQVKEHDEYGGVVPEIASRLHAEKIIHVLQNIGRDTISEVDFISVTTHPGLPGSLIVGKATANMLGAYFDKEVVEINHIQGHIFSLLLERKISAITFPIAMLTVSGGHNDLYIINSLSDIKKIGTSIDDAAGEAFDKVARMLGGPYPGGPWIEQMADKFSPGTAYKSPLVFSPSKKGTPLLDENFGTGKFFRRIWLDKEAFDFSFSGIKSQVHNLLDKLKKQDIAITEDIQKIVAYEFQSSVIDVLNTKLLNAAEQFGAKSIAICGGVSASDEWRSQLQAASHDGCGLPTYRPVKKLYSTDNAAMIGLVGILKEIS